MNAPELFLQWNTAIRNLVWSQLAPTFLLITTIGMLEQASSAHQFTKLALALILAASGILGALVQFVSAGQAISAAKALKETNGDSPIQQAILRYAAWLPVAKFVTPAIFIAIFVLITARLFA